MWHIVNVDKDESFVQDTIGWYAIVNVTKQGDIRVDLMSNTDEPIVTYYGTDARSLYKRITKDFPTIHPEHSAYLGFELARAELLGRKGYTQE